MTYRLPATSNAIALTPPPSFGVELVVSRIEAKAKLSQNRTAEDVEGVIAGLRERGDKEAADAVERANA